MQFLTSAKVRALEFNMISGLVNEFTTNLETEIQRILSDAVNNSTNFISNQIVTYPNVSIDNSFNGTTGITDSQIVMSNGFCNATLIGGIGNDTLASRGNCDDQLVGGPGVDKFICGGGTDITKDYNPKHGDKVGISN
jgi:hypothetical protein